MPATMFPRRGGGTIIRLWATRQLLHRPTAGRPALLLPSYSLFSSATVGGGAVQDRGPPPIRVSATESAGRGVFATRPIGAGELIHTAKPLVAHPSPSLINDVCYYCLRRLGGGDCIGISGAGGAMYRFCSESCREHSKAFCKVERTADWLEFDDYCKARGLKYPFLVKRLACMIVSGTTSADILDILQPASISSDLVSQMDEEFKLLKSTFMKAQIENEVLAFLTRSWYIEVLARIRINAFRIELVGGSYEDLLAFASSAVAADAAVGNAIYMLPSFYNHDCDPNTHIIWIDNADAKLKALCDIEADEELRICYIDASMDHNARQTLLSKGFGFQCQCHRCISGD